MARASRALPRKYGVTRIKKEGWRQYFGGPISEREVDERGPVDAAKGKYK